MPRFDLEQDLLRNDAVRKLVQTDRDFGYELYAALCNNQFVHTRMEHPDKDYWSCTWRYAGSIVSDIASEGGDYMNYYCSGREGAISPRVAEILTTMDWSGHPWPGEQY